MWQVALSSAPQFLVGTQLGKGGLGQVFKGTRLLPAGLERPLQAPPGGHTRPLCSAVALPIKH